MSKTLLAIDPGTNATGAAVFADGELIAAKTFKTEPNLSALKRYQDLTGQLLDWVSFHNFGIQEAVVEDPLLKGKSNQTMQRFIGFLCNDLVHYCDLYIAPTNVSFVHPSTVKSRLGSIDKHHLALNAFNELNEAEQAVMNPLVETEQWDATDAIAIGLTKLRRTPRDRDNGSDESAASSKGNEKGKRQNKKKKGVKRTRKGSGSKTKQV